MFFDRLTLDAPRRTSDGYLVTRAKAARTGVYQYTGAEVDPSNEHGLRDEAVVNVLRDDETVFDKKALHSFIGKPITDNHPTVPVSADNWRDHARGVVMGAVRDGEYISFDLLLTDAAAITAVEAGKRELSNGYGSELQFGDFKAPDGTRCQARQASIKGNHVAIVDKGRAGSECRIADAAKCSSLPADVFELLADGQTYRGDANNGNFPTDRSDATKSQSGAARRDGEGLMATKTIIFDGMPIEATDQAEAAILKLQGEVKSLGDAKAKAENDLAAAITDKANLEAEKVTLTKQIEDAKVTPAQLRDAAKQYQAVVDKAKSLGVKVTDEMDELAIMKAAVAAKVGDAGKDWNDEQIAASFASLTLSAKDSKVDPVRAAIASGTVVANDTASIRNAARESRYASN